MPRAAAQVPERLYHGTLAAHRASIERDGLRPMAGAFARDVYPRTSTQVLCACEAGLLRKAWGAMRFQVGAHLGKGRRLVTMAEVEEHGMLVVLPVDGFELSTSDRAPRRPRQVERHDWWRMTTARPDAYMSGRAIVEEFVRVGAGVHPAQHLGTDVADALERVAERHGVTGRGDAIGVVRSRCDVRPGMDLRDSMPKLRRMLGCLISNPDGRAAKSLVRSFEADVAWHEKWEAEYEARRAKADAGMPSPGP